MGINLKNLLLSGGFCVCALSTTVHAALVEVMGDTVIFRWDTATIDPKYGNPIVVGDSIFVTPTDFLAQSNNDDGAVTSTGTGTIQIIAKAGYVLDRINFGEQGDYRMTAGADSVDVDPYLRVFEWGTIPGFGQELILDDVPITGDLTIKDNNLHSWSATATLELTGVEWDGIDNVGLTLQNTLNATSLVAGESALIQKKAVGSSIEVSTSVIPVPAAIWLFGSGLLGLMGICRRRG